MGHFCKWNSLGRLDRSSCMGPKDVPGVVGIYAFVFSVDTTSSNIRELIRCWKLSDKFLVHSELDKWSEPVQRNTFQPCLSWARWYDRSSERKNFKKISTKRYLFLELLDQTQQKYCKAMANKPTNTMFSSIKRHWIPSWRRYTTPTKRVHFNFNLNYMQ